MDQRWGLYTVVRDEKMMGCFIWTLEVIVGLGRFRRGGMIKVNFEMALVSARQNWTLVSDGVFIR
jgi:hypothetical protein